jgi:hypothetical protein
VGLFTSTYKIPVVNCDPVIKFIYIYLFIYLLVSFSRRTLLHGVSKYIYTYIYMCIYIIYVNAL